MAPIVLYVPFYSPDDPARAAEITECLERNIALDAIDRVVFLKDDDTANPFANEKITELRLEKRPTYADWMIHACRHFPDHVKILANSDIYFDDTIAEARKVFSHSPQTLIALSRYDRVNGEEIVHPNPHWSQDTWVLGPDVAVPGDLLDLADIPLGTPRCDNKIAYLFSIHGFDVTNPVDTITSVHVHETQYRTYSKTGDLRIKGGMAFVHPAAGPTEPSKLDIEVWTLKSEHVSEPIKINKTLEKWSGQAQTETENARGLFTYDRDWQYPAITEKHAYRKMIDHIDAGYCMEPGTAYLGFPWATMVDVFSYATHRKGLIARLEEALEELADRLKDFDRVVTVCQHIRTERFLDRIAATGVTDIYWSHCRKGQIALHDAPDLNVYPFPLYPVQQRRVTRKTLNKDRPILFSFVGARANKHYLNDTRTLILDHLADHPDGKIIDRDSWHYQSIVYDKQVAGKAGNGAVDEEASRVFRDMLDNSVFTLCPSGTGPNSIRLWEAALNGSIPVVISDTLAPPKDAGLWSLGTVQCRETKSDILALPARLKELAANTDRLTRKRMALKLLADKYGPATFVHDILSAHCTYSPEAQRLQGASA